MTRFTRRVVTAVVSPALVVALAQIPVTAHSAAPARTQHTASPTKVCILNPVWGDAPCLN